MKFTHATKKQAKLRLAIIGPSGSGKTYTALTIATGLGGKIAVIDTEHGSASKYSDIFDFDTLELSEFAPITYVEAIGAAASAGYDVLIIDSLSHAWIGKGGALEQVDNIAKRTQSHNTFTAWRDVTPSHNAMVEAIVQSPCHVIVTMRSKTEYVMETNEKGKITPRKVGVAPIQRDGLEYEFDVVADMTLDNDLIISKTRCPAMFGKIVNKPTAEFTAPLVKWLTDGEKVTQPAPIEYPADLLLEKNSQGIFYTELPTKTLTYMVNEMRGIIAKNGLEPEKKAEYERKIDVASKIIELRK
jgi:hypothetical protein